MGSLSQSGVDRPGAETKGDWYSSTCDSVASAAACVIADALPAASTIIVSKRMSPPGTHARHFPASQSERNHRIDLRLLIGGLVPGRVTG
jgi:hypothetical protein